jgi:hypothetical protein
MNVICKRFSPYRLSYGMEEPAGGQYNPMGLASPPAGYYYEPS